MGARLGNEIIHEPKAFPEYRRRTTRAWPDRIGLMRAANWPITTAPAWAHHHHQSPTERRTSQLTLQPAA
jgi:hypothetical protein